MNSQDETFPKLVFWSTRTSIDREIPSITAIVETLLAVAVYWWIAVSFKTFLPLLLSVAVAPLVLLRSEESVALGAKWFKEWERSRWEDQRKYFELEQSQRRRISSTTTISALLAGLVAISITYYFDLHTVSGQILSHAFSFALIAAAGSIVMVTGGALVLMLGGTGAIAATIAIGVEVTILSIGVAAGISIAAKLVGIIVAAEVVGGAAVGTRAGAGAGPIGVARQAGLVSIETLPTRRTVFREFLFLNSFFYAPFVFGLGLGVFIVSLVIRVGATACHILVGLRDLPHNFWRLTLCTSPSQPPELIPGLGKDETQFSLQNIRQRFGRELSGDIYNKVFALILFPPAIALWFFPGWFYRITIKSTSWLWWPFAFLNRPPQLSNNPRWFYKSMVEEKLVPFKIFLACLCIVTFIWLSIWQTLKSGNHLENPFLNIVGYAFSIDWSSTPWQLLAVAGAFLSIVAVRLVDLNFQKFQTALETKDDVLVSNALSRLSCIERLCRLRTLLFLAYCTLVSFQAILVWNAHACWFIPYPFVDAVAQSFYHGYLPPSQCSN